jgi:hypothetical protein
MSPFLAEALDPAGLFRMALETCLRVVHMVEVVEAHLVFHEDHFGHGKCRPGAEKQKED